MVDRLPCPIVAEPGEPAIHGGPWRKALRQHVPGAAASKGKEHRIDELAHRPLAMTATLAGRRQEWGKNLPFRIGQVASIAQPRAAMLRTGGRGPHDVSGKASNTCSESHPLRPSNPYPRTFHIDSEMASKRLVL